MEGITPDQLLNAVTVMMAVFAVIISADKVYDIWKKRKEPSANIAKMLAADKARLDAHEQSILSLRNSNKALCSGVMALLDHELHNGNPDQMQAAKNEIMHCLQDKI